jgi:hypothetical protein
MPQDNPFITGLEASARAAGMTAPRIVHTPEWALYDDSGAEPVHVHTFTGAIDTARHISTIAELHTFLNTLSAQPAEGAA